MQNMLSVQESNSDVDGVARPRLTDRDFWVAVAIGFIVTFLLSYGLLFLVSGDVALTSDAIGSALTFPMPENAFFLVVAFIGAAGLWLMPEPSYENTVRVGMLSLIAVVLYYFEGLLLVYAVHDSSPGGVLGIALAAQAIGLFFIPLSVGLLGHRNLVWRYALVGLLIAWSGIPRVITIGADYRIQSKYNHEAALDITAGESSRWACSGESGIWDPDDPTSCIHWKSAADQPWVCIGTLNGATGNEGGRCRTWSSSDHWPPLVY